MSSSALPIHAGIGVLRAIGKVALWLFAATFAIVVAWFAANRLLDEAPDPQRDTFLIKSEDRIPDAKNAAVGILGLSAPSGTDSVQHGSRVKALYEAGAPWAEIQKMVQGPSALTLTVNSDQVTCWLDPDHPAYAGFKGCLPFERAAKVLQENREALDRFKSLFRMGAYSNLEGSRNQVFLVLPRLSAAEIHLSLRERQYEAAYRAWRDQLSFVKRNLRGPDTWVGKAIGLVAFGMTFELIENLVNANPRLASVHRKELLALLGPEGIQVFNPDGIVRAEYALLRQAFRHPPAAVKEWPVDRLQWLTFYFGQQHRFFNRYYAFARDYASMLRLPWNQVEAEAARLREKHVLPSTWDLVLDPFGSLFLGRYVDSQLRAREMLRQMHIVDGKLRLATLLVRIVDEGVQDSDIPAFLASVDPAFHDPFSRNPMQWSAKERRIYFPDPENKCLMYASLRLPPRPHTARALPSERRSAAC